MDIIHINKTKPPAKTKAIQFFLLALGVFCVCAGVQNGDFQLTMQKAIRLCMECVGIG